ncbi:pyridoxamine 5'-phosphate oxidase family protein [Methanofollis fontis]|uniref:Pyridoxamine 5'-phosphate oxidase family protein n=1 Tax=Methanofollis fontis TaxID=2052832 RepID=A0A483CPF6_9EURY|nr:pyridoxamine 5'-phosphate oxidase family protein [Methanofollis fontis]TAJ44922.1 pyridoxamine 5'-phosphate oxidase family protein [Methanofollis fontis]
MRRADREITDQAELEMALNEAVYATFALCGDDGPYAVPLNFAHHCGAIYIHSALEGRKVEILRENPVVGFSAVVGAELLPAETPCGWGMRYHSVCGTGTAEMIDDSAEKARALNLIMAKYSGRGGHAFTEEVLAMVCVFRIRIIGMTGKRVG